MKRNDCRQRIGINALFLVPNEVGGTENYVRTTLEALDTQHGNFEFFVFCSNEAAPTFSSLRHIQIVECPIHSKNRIARIIFEQLFFWLWLLLYRIDLLHSMGYFGPVTPPCRHIITVHDVNWIDEPNDSSLFAQMVTHILTLGSSLFALKIITDSSWSGSRLCFHFPWLQEKICVVSPGVAPEFFINQETNLSSRIVLCVSQLYPHKNIPYLFSLWNRVLQQEPEARLVLIGKNGSDFSLVRDLISSLSSVLWLPSVSFSELLDWYQQAKVVVIPSTYEGFGYPVYEALALKKPVIVGKTELYEKAIQPFLQELTFSKNTDADAIVGLLRKSAKKQNIDTSVISTQKSSAQKLLTIYQELFDIL